MLSFLRSHLVYIGHKTRDLAKSIRNILMLYSVTTIFYYSALWIRRSDPAQFDQNYNMYKRRFNLKWIWTPILHDKVYFMSKQVKKQIYLLWMVRKKHVNVCLYICLLIWKRQFLYGFVVLTRFSFFYAIFRTSGLYLHNYGIFFTDKSVSQEFNDQICQRCEIIFFCNIRSFHISFALNSCFCKI